MKYIQVLLILLALVIPVAAQNPMVNTTVETTVVNSTFLNINIWYIITVAGWLFLFVSQVCGKKQGSAIWALIAPFFTFVSAWFSVMLDYPMATTYFNETTMQFYTINQHFVYHLDWAAVGVLGFIFILSCINLPYVWFGKRENDDNATKQDIYGSKNKF